MSPVDTQPSPGDTELTKCVCMLEQVLLGEYSGTREKPEEKKNSCPTEGDDCSRSGSFSFFVSKFSIVK